MLEIINTILLVLIIPVVGTYFRTRMKNLATKNDFDDAIEQLEKSTKAVENIKSQLNEKY